MDMQCGWLVAGYWLPIGDRLDAYWLLIGLHWLHVLERCCRRHCRLCSRRARRIPASTGSTSTHQVILGLGFM